MPKPERASSAWRKSGRSDPQACVEVRYVGDVVQVRDSKDPDGPILTFTRREWAAFVEGVRLLRT
jgi:hypothetical protein